MMNTWDCDVANFSGSPVPIGYTAKVYTCIYIRVENAL